MSFFRGWLLCRVFVGASRFAVGLGAPLGVHGFGVLVQFVDLYGVSQPVERAVRVSWGAYRGYYIYMAHRH